MLFMPNPEHYEHLFTDHPEEHWATGSASAIWDLRTGQILYATGIQSRESIRLRADPMAKWLKHFK